MLGLEQESGARSQESVKAGLAFRVAERTIPARSCLLFGTVDVAASVKESADYTAVCSWAVTPANELLWLDCVRARVEVPDILPMLEKAHRKWGLAYLAIEGGGTQKAAYQLAKRSKLAVRELLPGNKDKLAQALPAIVLAESGRVFVPQGARWVEDALGELTRFTGDPKKDAHDDIADCLAWAARAVA